MPMFKNKILIKLLLRFEGPKTPIFYHNMLSKTDTFWLNIFSGMYAEMERLGTNLNDIDTTDCDYSLESLQVVTI